MYSVIELLLLQWYESLTPAERHAVAEWLHTDDTADLESLASHDGWRDFLKQLDDLPDAPGTISLN